MADGTRVVEPRDGTTVETVIDSFEVVFGVGVDEVRDRQRVALAGRAPGSDVPVLNSGPPGNAYGLVTRPVHAPGGAIFSEVLDVIPGATVNVVAYTVPKTGLRIAGFAATGEGDARFRLLIDAQVVMSGRISALQPDLLRALPAPIPVPQGAALVLNVRCDSTVACDYEGTIFTEAHDG